MTARVLKDALGWGLVLWLFGYILGMILFAFVPVAWIGWILTPFAAGFTIWVASTRVSGPSLDHYAKVAAAWLTIAVAGDYLAIVRLFHPPDGYYKPDVYLYYFLTVAIPLATGWCKHPPLLGR